MKIPLIGVTPGYDAEKKQIYIHHSYFDGILRAGGLPAAIPISPDAGSVKSICAAFDGILFSGGPDIRPNLYGEELLNCCGAICAERDEFELALFAEAVGKAGKPAFGICRGIQAFNVALGGSLYQDLPVQYKSGVTAEHNQKPPYDAPSHRAGVVPESPLHNLTRRESIEVNSSHHQGIRALAPALEVMAYADDGLIEAVFLPGPAFAQAVQWHPERMPEDGHSRLLFETFVNACG